ncbi:sugar kinase [Marinomonas rhizomae]|uniref:Sugar/nucleoside kinase (Ribokinase family) n=1 Tax=Marinomonas rhizomae TaxID=491948 RepID=A0A366JB88_9GAMM|nr:sugar kinase [Marinomonas rhizomae]RBP83495.1 sugar/nucleoside kinase (ribokinase family) [Marinomonas rhizomae]
MKEVITLGEVIVEVMAKKTNQLFIESGEFLGPYPSGAPAIFINQVAKMKVPASIIGCVGQDDFGKVCLNRLIENGVNTSLIDVDNELPTGTAFVRYQSNGSRNFIFNIRHSAAAAFYLTDVAKERLSTCAVLHVMGSSIFSHAVINMVREAIEIVRNNGGRISFDPNVREELLSDSTLFEFFKEVLANTDIFLPSGEELYALTNKQTLEDAVESALELGVSEIVLKQGADGCAFYSHNDYFFMPSFSVEEIDATGAGDTFGATYIACRELGYSPKKSLGLANASGATAVSHWGPMEGASSEEELNKFIDTFIESLEEI